MTARNNTQDRSETQGMLLDGLQDKVKEAKRKIELQERAMEDLAEKMEEVKD